MDMIHGGAQFNPDNQAISEFENTRSQYAMSGKSQLFDESGLSPMLSGSRPSSNNYNNSIQQKNTTNTPTRLKQEIEKLVKKGRAAMGSPINDKLKALDDSILGPAIINMFQSSGNTNLEQIIDSVIVNSKQMKQQRQISQLSPNGMRLAVQSLAPSPQPIRRRRGRPVGSRGRGPAFFNNINTNLSPGGSEYQASGSPFKSNNPPGGF
jgi:hypothetical protein